MVDERGVVGARAERVEVAVVPMLSERVTGHGRVGDCAEGAREHGRERRRALCTKVRAAHADVDTRVERLRKA